MLIDKISNTLCSEHHYTDRCDYCYDHDTQLINQADSGDDRIK
jgi:hypothetical protein